MAETIKESSSRNAQLSSENEINSEEDNMPPVNTLKKKLAEGKKKQLTEKRTEMKETWKKMNQKRESRQINRHLRIINLSSVSSVRQKTNLTCVRLQCVLLMFTKTVLA